MDINMTEKGNPICLFAIFKTDCVTLKMASHRIQAFAATFKQTLTIRNTKQIPPSLRLHLQSLTQI